MRILNEQIISAGDASQATVTSLQVDTTHIGLFSVVVAITGSPVGSLKLQASNDNGTTWADMGITQAVSAAGNFYLTAPDLACGDIRVVYTKTSGTGAINAYANCKGF